MPFIRNEETLRVGAELRRTDEEQPGAEMPKAFSSSSNSAQVEPIEALTYADGGIEVSAEYGGAVFVVTGEEILV
jgi:hypothetical protein